MKKLVSILTSDIFIIFAFVVSFALIAFFYDPSTRY